MDWKNRIIGFEIRPAGSFQPNPLNPRIHPPAQRKAVKGSLDTLGWIGAVTVNRRIDSGEEVLIDGHERLWQSLAKGEDTPVPTIIVELTLNEERLALSSYDFITSMADYDKGILKELLSECNTTNADMQQLLADIADTEKLFLAGIDEPTPTVDRTIQCPECGCEFEG